MELGEKRESIYLSLHCHHQHDSCLKMGNDESHFNVSLICEGQSHKTVSTNHNLFEEKGEPDRILNGFRFSVTAFYTRSIQRAQVLSCELIKRGADNRPEVCTIFDRQLSSLTQASSR